MDSLHDTEILHVADPPLADPQYSLPLCRRRSTAVGAALRESLDLARDGRGDGVMVAVLKKDGSVEYWVAGRALADPVRASGAAARLLDLANRLPSYLSEPFPD